MFPCDHYCHVGGREARPIPMHGLRQPHPIRRRHHPAHARLSSLHGRRGAEPRGRRGALRGDRGRLVPLVRERGQRRGAGRGSGRRTMTAPTVLLKPALEAVMQVARQGEAAEPTEPAPAQLRRYLRFARLPAPALDIARRVVEEDDAFRERVAQQLTEDDVGEAGWLWLTRPAGWEERLEELRKHQQEQEHAVHEERAEREAHRRLSGAEDRARRAEVALTARSRDVAQALDQLAHEHALREHAEAELTRIAASIDELTQ